MKRLDVFQFRFVLKQQITWTLNNAPGAAKQSR